MVHDGDQQIDVPVSALRMLVNILAQMAQGNAVSLVPFHAELTTQQAAGFLNVSRPYLVKLLERDVLKYRRVGTHRRIAFSELLQYRQKLAAEGREAAAKLSREAEDLGLVGTRGWIPLASQYDACVLYPAPLRDLLVRLAQTGLFRGRWTAQIHEEWIRALLTNCPDLTRERLERTRSLMDAAVPDCLVTGHERLLAGLTLPDPDDCHVLAAAIACQAGVIVTYNLRDFPDSELARFGIEVQHPDAFIRHLFDLSPAAVCQTVKELRSDLRKHPKTVHNPQIYFWAQALQRPFPRSRP